MKQPLHHFGVQRERHLQTAILPMIADDGMFPINAILSLPVYREAVALPVPDPAAEFEALFAAHHWLSVWRDGI